jgi:catechol 2,3-dioxygenase-like lactoylglutathione lyase family enzyme
MFWTKQRFSSTGDVVAEVRDVQAAQRWYAEKLGRPYSSTEVEEASMELGYSADSVVVYLVDISAKKLADAHQYLSARGVDVGSIQSDSGGNQFFRFRDLEGNELEVCQEH